MDTLHLCINIDEQVAMTFAISMQHRTTPDQWLSFPRMKEETHGSGQWIQPNYTFFDS